MKSSFNEIHICFGGTFRDYQQSVLDQADTYLKDGRIHIVAAPGSGKTILGLELIRRLGQPALILSPSVTIRQQWGDRFEQNFLSGLPQEKRGDYARAVTSYSLASMNGKLITSVTYQSLHAAMKRIESREETSEWSEDSGTGNENFAGFELLAEVRKNGIKTVCLDEAHHLRSEWQRALEEFLKAMDNTITVIALTATPPYDSTPGEWERYSKLCGDIDAEIFVPQLVAQRTLCPHQDYIYFNYPDKAEYELVIAHRQKAMEVTGKLMADKFLSTALTEAGILPEYKEKEALILENPRAFAAICSCIHNGEGTELPRGLVKTVSPRGLLPSYELSTLEEAFAFILEQAEIFPEALRDSLSKQLSAAGLIERKKLCLATTDQLKRMLLSSIGKLDSILQIAEAEGSRMGSSLRMLILTDHIRRELTGAIGTDDPLRSMGAVPIFEALRRRLGDSLPLAVLTGSLIIIPHTALEVVTQLTQEAGISLRAKALGDTGYDELIMSGSNKHKVGVMTEAFSKGCFCVLIGTTSLLGEGWDSPCINTLILASFVGSFMLSNQMRGRAIRIDRNVPDKCSNIWHLVTVEPPLTLPEVFHQGTERPSAITNGRDTAVVTGDDYATMMRRFEGFLAPVYHSDRIESGIDRLDVIHPPYDKEGIAQINRDMLTLAEDRQGMAQKWISALGDDPCPEISLANQIPRASAQRPTLIRNAVATGLTTAPMATLLTQGMVSMAATGNVLGLVVAAPLLPLYLYGLAKWVPKILSHATPARSVKTLAHALLKTLKELKLIESPKAKVQILPPGDDQDVICALRNASEHEKSLFAAAVAELLSPIDDPRYVIVKKARLFKQTLTMHEESFACPSIIANKKENVACFAKHLAISTGHFEPVYTRSEEGRQLLLQCRKKSYANRNDHAITGKKIVRPK